MPVKHHGNGPHEVPTLAGDLHRTRLDGDQAHLDEGLELLQLATEILGHLDQVGEFDRFELQPALAHQRHDDRPTEQVVAVQGQAANHRELALAQGVVVLRQGLGALAVGGAHAADG